YMTDGGVTVSSFSIDEGTGSVSLTPVSRVRTGGQESGAFSITLNPLGTLLFVADAYPDGNISVFSVDTASGGLSVSSGPFMTGPGTEPVALAVDPSGSFLYTANHRSDNISAYRIAPGTGALTPVPGSPFPAGIEPSAIAILQ